MRDLVIVGAGGFGRETIDTVRAINEVAPTWRIAGVVDDSLSAINAARLETLGVPYLGDLDDVTKGSSVAVAVGSPGIRRAIVDRLTGRGVLDFPPLIHPTTTIGSAFTHGVGLITLAGVSIGTNVQLGDHVHLNAHAVIGHDTTLADHVSVNPNATVSGDCALAADILVGAGSTVLQGLSIGPGATVGAGACVTKDIPADAVVVGVPAHPLPERRTA